MIETKEHHEARIEHEKMKNKEDVRGRIVDALIFGIIFALIFGIIFALVYGFVDALIFGLVYGIVVGLVYGILAGLVAGLVFLLVYGLTTQIIAYFFSTSIFSAFGFWSSLVGLIIFQSIGWYLVWRLKNDRN